MHLNGLWLASYGCIPSYSTQLCVHIGSVASHNALCSLLIQWVEVDLISKVFFMGSLLNETASSSK